MSALAERSRAAVAARFPELGPALADIPAVSQAIHDGEALIDIDLGPARLYNGDGRAVAAEQVRAFNAKPLQFFANSPSMANLGSPISGAMLGRMLHELGPQGAAALIAKPDYDGSFLIVLGIGAGHHLPDLIATTKARHLLIVEPIPEFLRHALGAIDWAALFEVAERRGITLRLSLAERPDRITHAIELFIQRVGEPFIDGGFVFLHYPSWALVEARDRLPLAINQNFISRGFYEDELTMMTNAVANLRRHDSRVIDSRLRLARAETAILVGSGPSIDRDLEHLRRLAGQGIVFSAGTGLRVCLRNGIVPDFHCELENGEPTYDSLRKLADSHDLGGIRLIASVTVDPRVPALFDACFFFFRDTVSSTRILAPPGHELFGAGPTCVNTAMRLGNALGFKQFVLFGTDCGAKLGGLKHSKDAIYHDDPRFQEFERKKAMSHRLPGNFGGEVATDWIFGLCARLLGDLARTFRLTVWNTADGARIAGTTPRLAAAIPGFEVTADRARLLADIARSTTPYQPGEFFATLGAGSLAEAAARAFDDVAALVDAAEAEGEDLAAFWSRLTGFFQAATKDYRRTASIILGSLRSSPKIGMFFIHRVPDPARRAALTAAFYDQFRINLATMRAGTLALLDEVDAQLGAAAARRAG